MSISRRNLARLVCSLFVLLPTIVFAEESPRNDPAKIEFFEKKIPADLSQTIATTAIPQVQTQEVAYGSMIETV